MELEKTKNTVNGFVSGVIGQVVNTLLPFILRTVMIYTMGIEFAGVNSLFNSILNVLSLADLGFGSAVIYSMYIPIKENDNDQLCKLLGYYRTLYFYVGGIIFCAGLFVVPFLKLIVTSEIPGNMNIYILYFCFLGNTTISYLFGGYRSSVLFAYQRRDIYTYVTTAVTIIGYAAQIIVLLVFKEYYLYLAIMIAINLATALSTAYTAKRMFPDIVPQPGLDKEGKRSIFAKVADLLYQRIGSTFSTSLDSIVISSFLGLTEVAIYGNYFYVFNAASSFMNSFFSSLTAGIGNKILTSDDEENMKVYKHLSTISNILVTFCCSCLLALYQPFVNWWTGPEFMYPITIVILFAVYFFIYGSRRIVMTYKDALGMWHRDRWKSIVGAGFNLIVNIMLVRMIGVSGVIISTILSYLLVEMPWETHVLYTEYFKRSELEFYRSLLKSFLITVIVCGIAYYSVNLIHIENNSIQLLISALVCIVVTMLSITLIYHRNESFQFAMERFRDILAKKREA